VIELPTDAQLVDAAAATYTATLPWLQFAEDRLFRSQLPSGVMVFSFEGTYNAPGWVGDFLALGVRDHETTNHPTLGFVHLDFYQSALQFIAPLAAAAKEGPIALGGHSRGAILALMAAGLLIDGGAPVIKIGAFAPPRGGGPTFIKIVTSISFCAYKFGDDPVPEVPFTLMPAFPYEQVPLSKIGEPLTNALDCHHIANYVSGVHAMEAVA